MTVVSIRVEELGKKYRVYSARDSYRTLRDSLTTFFNSTFRFGREDRSEYKAAKEFWALKDVSFQVNKGEVVGVIGRNGAGKSTLLKILSRITQPTVGFGEIHGRLGSLLEVGTGFHPELSGRENIYLNGAILGMPKREIDRKFDEIVAFAEVERFIDTPVKHYSSGMYLRLAFAVSAHLDPEILLVDEVLAVGDATFQKRCLGKMGDVARDGRTVLFVSHNMSAIQHLCSKAILLDQGTVLMQGEAGEVIQKYLQHGVSPVASASVRDRKDRQGSGAVRCLSVAFIDRNGQNAGTFLSGDEMGIEIGYQFMHEISPSAAILVGVSVRDVYDTTLFLCSNELTGEIASSWANVGVATCQFRRLPLLSGVYKINIFVSVNGVVADWITDAATFEVENGDYYRTGKTPATSHGRFLVEHSWTLKH